MSARAEAVEPACKAEAEGRAIVQALQPSMPLGWRVYGAKVDRERGQVVAGAHGPFWTVCACGCGAWGYEYAAKVEAAATVDELRTALRSAILSVCYPMGEV